MSKVTDEMLMAFVDGELDRDSAATVARAVAGDPTLQQRLAGFRRTRLLAKQAFSPVLEEAVPERLITAAGGPRVQDRFPWASRINRLFLPIGAAVAATAGFLIAVAILERPPVGSAPPSLAPELATILESVPSGESRSLAGGFGVVPTATYLAPGGVCRTFDVTLDGKSRAVWHEVACRHNGAWEVELAVVDHGAAGDGSFAPASGGVAATLDSFLDAIGAGESLDETTERSLREHGWQMNG